MGRLDGATVGQMDGEKFYFPLDVGNRCSGKDKVSHCTGVGDCQVDSDFNTTHIE